MENNSDRKVNFIYLYKIVFTIAIFHLHYYAWYGMKTGGWYIGVDFFFLLSGFLLSDEFFEKKRLNLSITEWIKHKVKRLWPHYIVSLMILIIAMHDVSIYKALLEAIWMNFACLGNNINTPDWYVVVLFWIEIIYFILFKYILKKNRCSRYSVINGVICLFVYSILIIRMGNIDLWTNVKGIIPMGLVRGFCGIGVGMSLREISTKKYFENKCGNSSFNKFFTMLLVSIILILTYKKAWSRWDLVALIIYCVVVLISFKCYLPNKVSCHIQTLSRLSYPAYLNQTFLIKVFSRIFNYHMHKWYTFLCFVVIDFLFAFILDRYIISEIEKVVKRER